MGASHALLRRMTMAFEWDEAKARERVTAYTEALEAVHVSCGKDLNERSRTEARERLEVHCWHDLRHAFAEIDRLRAKLATPEKML